MRRKSFILLLIAATFVFEAMGQENKDQTAGKEKTEKVVAEARTEDVSSIDGIIKATYEAISGGIDQKRDWARFRSLFHADARLMPSGRNPDTGVTGVRAFTPGEYIERSEPFLMKNGFYEKEIARTADIYGNIAHVFSTYEGRNKLSDEKPIIRGINSFQLINDGKRWWVLTIFWLGETPDNLVPDKYLKNGQ